MIPRLRHATLSIEMGKPKEHPARLPSADP